MIFMTSHRNSHKRLKLIVLALLLLPQVDAQTQRTTRVLFVGNSLSYTNNLPLLLQEEAYSNSIELYTDLIAEPNYALIDHWKDRKVQKAIAEGAYDFVIIQQGPSSQEFGKGILIEYGRKFKDLCDRYGSQLLYFMVWPALENASTFDAVINNHYEAARINEALVCAVGEQWQLALKNNPSPGLYAQDGFHPSLKGSRFAARLLFECLSL